MKFSASQDDPVAPFSAKGDVLFEGLGETGNNQFDAEAVMVTSDDEVVIGSDNGLKVDGFEQQRRYMDGDSKVLVAPTDDDGTGLQA